MSETKRKSYIDVVAGFMILWMVIDHCRFITGMGIPLIKYLPVEKLLGFYMPWFYYKSGLFFSHKNQPDLFRKDTSKFLRYYIIYSFLGWSIWCVCGYFDNSLQSSDFFVIPLNNFIKKGSITGNGPLWFLISLVCVRQIANIVIKKNLSIPVVALISLLIAFILYKLKWYMYSWWFGNIFSGLFFFLFGYLLKNKESNKVIFGISGLVYVIIVGVCFLGYSRGLPLLYMLANKMLSGNYLLFFPMALASIIIINNVFRFIEKRGWLKCFFYFEFFGKNSMNIYITHWILLTFALYIIKSVFTIEQSYIQIIILVCVSLVCLPFISIIINLLKAKYEFLNKIL